MVATYIASIRPNGAMMLRNIGDGGAAMRDARP